MQSGLYQHCNSSKEYVEIGPYDRTSDGSPYFEYTSALACV